MTFKQYCEEKGILQATMYDRIKKNNYPYPPQQPFSQYDDLCYKTHYIKQVKKDIDVDQEWKRICRKHTDPDKREVAYLRVLKHIIPIPEEDIQALADASQRVDMKCPYTEFYHYYYPDDRGRPLKNTNYIEENEYEK